jgi:hypothetical protein
VLADQPYRSFEPKAARCPHCERVAEPKPHGDLRFVCASCGEPRIPGIDERELSSETLAGLVRARRERRVVRVAGGALVGASILSLLLFLLAFTGRVSTPAVGVFIGLGFLRRPKHVWRARLDAAWADAAAVLASKRVDALGPRELAAATHITTNDALDVLAVLHSRRGTAP